MDFSKVRIVRCGQFIFRIILVAIVSVFLCHSPLIAGTQIMSYGFEDWQGFNGNNSPAQGYIFSTDYESYWERHFTSTLVLESGACGSAFEGNYYHHTQFFTGGADPCLGRTATSINAATNMGYNGTYPLGTKNTTDFSQHITSSTITIRFYFRTTGAWTSVNDAIDNGGGLKWIRLYGAGTGDAASVLLKMLNDGDSTTPRLGIYNAGSPGYHWFTPGAYFQDGNWHSVVMRAVRNNDNNQPDNMTMTVWIDDWHMVGAGHSFTYTVPALGDHYTLCALNANWSAQYPVALMGMDIDLVEVWDGEPDSLSAPENLTVTE